MKTVGLTQGKYRLRRFSIEHLWCLTTLAGIFVFINTHPIRPHDFWWHIQAGREIVATAQIPAGDALSFTVPGRPYSNYTGYWLMESCLYIVYSLGGPALVVFAHSLIITVAYSLLLWLCWQLTRSGRLAALCTLFAAALGINDWNVRPQTITFLLVALILWAIYKYRQKPHWRWFIVLSLCAIVWVNSHPSFPLGLVLLGIWLADETWHAFRAWFSGNGKVRIKPLFPPSIALIAFALACLLNPRGLGIVAYLRSMGQNPIVQNLVGEWAPPSFDSLHGGIFLVGLLLSATILALSSRRPTLFQLLTFLAFGGLGLKTSRGAVWFGMVIAPILAHHLPSIAEQAKQLSKQSVPSQASETELPKSGPLFLNYFLASLMLLGALASLPWFKHRLPLPQDKAHLLSTETPLEATHFLLQEQLSGNLFHDQAFGSYLIWTAQPAYPVFVDPRIELYPPRIWLDYLEISAAGCGWEEKLEQYGVNTLMLSPKEQARLFEAALQSPNWRLVYQDSAAALFVRETHRHSCIRVESEAGPPAIIQAANM